MKQKITILSTDGWLCYSPSTLNLAKVLQDYFDVTILTFSAAKEHEISEDHILHLQGYFSRNRLLKRFEYLINRRSSRFRSGMKMLQLRRALRAQRPARLIAVDRAALHMLEKCRGNDNIPIDDNDDDDGIV